MTGSTKEFVAGFGLTNYSVSQVFRPRTPADLAALLDRLSREGPPVVFRGAGRSYGHVATNPSGPVVDLSLMNRIVSFDPVQGLVRAEAGATIGDLWKLTVGQGWWPPVVTGTMTVTLGGCFAANTHGKNHWKRGAFSEHVDEVTVADRGGSLKTLRKDDPEFPLLAGNFGATDALVELVLRMKKIETGFLDVEGFNLPNLAATLSCLEEGKEAWEYQVAWVDCFPSGPGLGRSAVHRASHVKGGSPGEDGLSVAAQMKELPDTVAGVVPKSLLAKALGLFTFDAGMRAVNAGKFVAGRLAGHHRYRQTLAGFNFLLDALPNWRDAYLPGGFIQHQLFVPKESALDVLSQAIALQRSCGVVSYLGVLKRHRFDPGPNGYTPDGFSLALDFPVTRRNASPLVSLCRQVDRLVWKAGGRVYRAKDCIGSWDRSREVAA